MVVVQASESTDRVPEHQPEVGVVEGVTVIRIAPSDFPPPYVLAAVRHAGALTCGRLLCDVDQLPAVGSVVRIDSGSTPNRFRPIK